MNADPESIWRPGRLWRGGYCTLLTALVAIGCQPAVETPQTPASPLAGAKLTLVVADDPPLLDALRRVQGEWATRTQSELTIQAVRAADLATAGELPGDAAIIPSPLLGTLAQRNCLRPLGGQTGGGGLGDVFELLRSREATWGERVMAVPLGSPVLVCYLRADLLAKVGREPPKTWDDYLDLAKALRQAAPAGDKNWQAVAEPLGPGWAGLVLLARAASMATHRDQFSTLFQLDTMEPLVAGPPFVRALEELVAAAKLGPAKQRTPDPAATRRAFWEERCGMALSWPTSAADLPAGKAAWDVVFAELPGSPQAYNIQTKTWDPRPRDGDGQVPLLSCAGRLGVVSATTRFPEAAEQLLLWLFGSTETGDGAPGSRRAPLAAVSPDTTLCRQSQMRFPRFWLEKPVGAKAAAQYADVVERALSHEQALRALPLPGRTQYLQALDEAVGAALDGKQAPAEALQAAATRWREITAKLGVAAQRDAYAKSLGLETP